MGMFVIAWSIRLSMMLLVLSLLIRLLASPQVARSQTVKWIWTASFVGFAIHVLSAFHFVHHWSHAEAYAATARETRQLLGREFGEGVYFNYLFLVVWAIDVVHRWLPLRKDSKYVRWLLGLGLVYLLFIAFNGLVVFKTGWLRWLGILASSALILAACYRSIILKTAARAAPPQIHCAPTKDSLTEAQSHGAE